MYVFISWADVSVAERQEEARKAWVSNLPSKTKEEKALVEKLTPEFCLPEYYQLQQAIEVNSDFKNGLPLDPLNRDLLSINVFDPGQDKSAKYQLHRRLPPEVKQPVSLAARSFLLKSFPGEWLPGSSRGNVTFVGFAGLKDFLKNFASCCAALSQPLPPSLWLADNVLEIQAGDATQLVESLAYNADSEKSREFFQNALLGWFGPGASASRDADVLRLAAATLGFLVQ